MEQGTVTYRIQVYRLPAKDNKPHRWSWALLNSAGMTVATGTVDSKKEALSRVQSALDFLNPTDSK